MNIVVLERQSVGADISMDCMRELGPVTYYDYTKTIDEVAERVVDADIIISNKAPLNQASLAKASSLKLICNLATGYDNIDLDYCRQRQIQVRNVVNYSTGVVTQHTFTLALSLLEKINYYDNYVKSGAYANCDSFSHFAVPFHELNGLTWGIVGMGNIGRKVAQVASAFGCKVIFHSITGNSSCQEYEQVTKEKLLADSDILSLHCPLSPLSEYFIDAKALQLMKPEAILINVARGKVVNNEALYEALMNGTIMAAGLDVLEEEPIKVTNPLSKITDSNKLIITPHSAWASVEARTRCVSETFENVKAFLANQDRNRLC